MTKERELQEEVRKAVANYVDELISQRTGAGKGCAISANDLLVAAKSAGQKVSRPEANDLLNSFVRPGMNIIKLSTNDKLVKRHGQAGRQAGPRGLHRPIKHRKDYHWMAWKTTPTPMPETPAPQAYTPCPPSRPPTRAYSAAARGFTPAPPTPEIDLVIPSPPPNRPVTVADLAPTPGPMTPMHMAPTPLPGRVDTPLSMRPDHHDFLASRQAVPADIAMKGVGQEKNPAFEPAISAWVNNANDYEKDVAYSLLKCLNGGMSANPRGRQQVRNAANGLQSLDMTRGTTAGVRTCVPVWKPGYMAPQHRQRQTVNALGQSMERQGPRPYTSNSVMGSEVPIHKHSIPGWSGPRGYVNEQSFFTNAQLPYRSNFTIHPEWVSEHQPLMPRAMKKISANKGPNGIRYGSK